MPPPGDVAAADRQVGVTLLDGPHHGQQRLGRMAQVGVDDGDGIAPRDLQPVEHRRRQAELARPVAAPARDSWSAKLLGERGGTIRRAIVDDDHLGVERPCEGRRQRSISSGRSPHSS